MATEMKSYQDYLTKYFPANPLPSTSQSKGLVPMLDGIRIAEQLIESLKNTSKQLPKR